MLFCLLSIPDRVPPLSVICVLFLESFTGNQPSLIVFTILFLDRFGKLFVRLVQKRV